VTASQAVNGDQAKFVYDIPRGGASFALRLAPQLLCVEALAQATAAFNAQQGSGEAEGGVLAALESVRFHLPLPRPGDQLRLMITRTKEFGPLVRFDGEAWVRHRLVAQAELVVRRVIE
jgi:3-hydroxymyristoyl/3-hydroxydecanoyl-(acyl carrier protein) dehydratase